MACNVFNSIANNSDVYKLSSHHWHVMTTARVWQTSSDRRDWRSVEWASSEHKNEHQQRISAQCCLRIDLLIPLFLKVQKLCESRGGRPGLPVPNSLYGLCGHKTTQSLNTPLPVHLISFVTILFQHKEMGRRQSIRLLFVTWWIGFRPDVRRRWRCAPRSGF